MYTKIFIPFILLLSSSLFSQTNGQSARLATEKANTAYEAHNYELALESYLVADSLGTDDAIISYRIGVCQRETYRFDEAIQAFNKTKTLGYSSNDINLMMAKTYHLAHQFEKAEAEYNKYGAGLDVSRITYDDLKAENDRHITQCQVGSRLKANPFEIKLQHLDANINSSSTEIAPLLSSDENVLLYSSDKSNKEGIFKLYNSKRTDETWSSSAELSNINKTEDDLCIGVSPDGSRLVLFRKNNLTGKNGELLISEKITSTEGFTWSTPKSLGENINSEYLEPSASLSEDNQTIYFTSNRPGGFGGTDIYTSQFIDGHWGNVTNMGKAVNTKHDEDSPYINKDVLYFSSKGHEGMGGYDLFMSVNLMGEWLEAINFGYPINSAKDDFQFVWNANGTRGYFSSIRKGSFGKSDIYVIVRPFDNPNMVYVKGTMNDEVSQQPISNANITLIDSSGGVVSEYKTDELGKYKLAAEMGKSYRVHVESDEYATVDYDLTVPKKSYYFEVTEDLKTVTKVEAEKRGDYVPTKEITKEESPVVETVVEEKEEIVEQTTQELSSDLTIYFDYKKTGLSSTAKKNLDEWVLVLKSSKETIQIAGHTDNVGGDTYNNWLAEERAKSVAKYLKSKGIPVSQLKLVSYGKQQLTSQDQSKNRRVVLSFL